MTQAHSRDFADHDQPDSTAPRMQRMSRKTQPLRGKYIKKRPSVRRGIKQRRTRRVMW